MEETTQSIMFSAITFR